MFLPPNSASVSHRFLCFSCFSILQCDFMTFKSCRVLRRGHSLALAPKKSVALQAEWVSSPDVAPISGRSRANVVALSAGQTSPVVPPMPSMGQAGVGAKEAPSGVAEQMTAEVTPPPTLEGTETPPVLVAPPMVGTASQVEPPASQAEVAVTTPSQEQPDVATAMSEGAAQSVPPVAPAATPEVGRTEEDTTGRSLGVVAVVERTNGRSHSALMSGGSRSPARGELPL